MSRGASLCASWHQRCTHLSLLAGGWQLVGSRADARPCCASVQLCPAVLLYTKRARTALLPLPGHTKLTPALLLNGPCPPLPARRHNLFLHHAAVRRADSSVEEYGDTSCGMGLWCALEEGVYSRFGLEGWHLH